MTKEEQQELWRSAVSTISFMLAAFEQVKDEAPWFIQAFEAGKKFLDENKERPS